MITQHSSQLLLKICQELHESAVYWSEYDVPLGIVDRLKQAIDNATDDQLTYETCKALALQLTGPELEHNWWNSPNAAFDNRTPEQMVLIEPQRVRNYLLQHTQGEW